MLGTPPAFILSQDQTLLFNLWFRSTLVNLSRFYCLLGLFPSSFRISETVPLNNSFLEFSGLHYCLFVKVLCRLFSLPALSGLRAFLGRNGDYLITCCFSSQALFSTFLIQLILFSTALAVEFYYSTFFLFLSTTFLNLFYKKFASC